MTKDLLQTFKELDLDPNEDGMTYNSKVLLIDGLHTFIRSWAAIPTMDDEGNHIGGTTGFLRSLGYITRIMKPTRVIVAFDGKGGSQRRRKILPEYKAHRKPFTRLNRPGDFRSDRNEVDSMKYQLVALMQILECLPVTVIQLENIEADDVIGYLAKHIEKQGGKVIIYSGDKDFLQLVNDKIIVHSPTKKKTYNTELIQAEYKTHPNNFVFYRALLGDKSDNIGGINGAGEKTLHKYLPELQDPVSNIDREFVVNKYKDVKKIPSVIKKIIAGEIVIKRNMLLMDLSEPQMSDHSRLKILDKFDSPLNQLRKTELTKLMHSTKIMTNFNNYAEWLAFSIVPLSRFQ